MNRLAYAIGNDIRLQYRNGFYFAAGFVACVSVIIIKSLGDLDLKLLMPALIINNLLIGTFFFIGGLVLLEKRERTLQAQVVTPLLPVEYLAAKVITLTILSLLENSIIVIFTFGMEFGIPALIMGILFGAALNCLLGFLAVARFDSINEYLFPSILITTVLLLPLIDYFGIWKHSIFYVHPYQAVLIMLKDAFSPVERWQLIYSSLYPCIWLVFTLWWGLQVFDRRIVSEELAG